jgi:hypothetical protein
MPELPGSILVHVGVPLTYDEPQTDPAEWIEGEPGPDGGGEPEQGAAFLCVLFLPGPGGEQQNAYRPRAVQQPTLLYNVVRDAYQAAVDPFPQVLGDGSTVDIANESELLITAPELAPWTRGVTVRWQVVGIPQAFGPPGSVFGAQATVRQVVD